MKQFILAHDIGTTGNKATLYDREGRLIGSAFYGYNTVYSYTGWAEQNPEDWWRAVCATTQQLLRQTPGVRPDDVACIVFSGQMMGCVPLDRAARPLRNALIWADTRSLAQERWVGERIAPERVYRITGHRLSASYSLTKMLWLRDHEPETYHSTYKFVHAKDAVAARLTGRFVTDPSDASSMNLFDIEAGAWSDEIIQATSINPEQLPPVIRSVDIVGEIQPDAAAQVGLPTGTPVVIGGGDGPCAAVGAGVIREGVAYNYIGSSSWIA
jgi:Sugar (pentulose and hexulose) kinases